MKYDTFEARVLPIFGFYFILIIFGMIVSFKLIRKYKERKQPAALHLAIVYMFFTSAVIVLAIGLTEAAITGYYKEIYRISLPLAYSLVVFANIFLFYFASNIMDKWIKFFPYLIISGTLLVIVIFLPWNWWGYPKVAYAGKLTIRLYTNIAFISYSYLIYISIAILCYETKQKSEDRVSRLGLSLLYYSMISMICYFIMILADNIMIIIFKHPGYSEFLYIAWVFALVFGLLSYFSLVMPDWMVKRIIKR